jgi:hypothetical protein
MNNPQIAHNISQITKQGTNINVTIYGENGIGKIQFCIEAKNATHLTQVLDMINPSGKSQVSQQSHSLPSVQNPFNSHFSNNNGNSSSSGYNFGNINPNWNH